MCNGEIPDSDFRMSTDTFCARNTRTRICTLLEAYFLPREGHLEKAVFESR